MKIIQIALIAMLLFCEADLMAQHKWSFFAISENEDTIYLSQKKSIGHGNYQVWAKWVAPDTGIPDYKRPNTIKEFVELSEYDCGQNKSRDLSRTTYFFDGSVISHDSILPWSYVVPETIGEEIMTYLCEGKKPENEVKQGSFFGDTALDNRMANWENPDTSIWHEPPYTHIDYLTHNVAPSPNSYLHPIHAYWTEVWQWCRSENERELNASSIDSSTILRANTSVHILFPRRPKVEYAPWSNTRTRNVSDTLRFSVKTEKARDGAILHAEWYRMGGYEGEPEEIGESEVALETGSNRSRFYLLRKMWWPIGGYKARILLDGVPKDSVEFNVMKLR
jgi:hypothetical protein